MPPSAFNEYLDAIELDLKQAALPFPSAAYAELVEMITYHHGWTGVQSGRGKRVRPLLTVLACLACGGEWRASLPAASAVELIHNFSLVHDDIEDRSQTRRGRPTLWSRWGVPQALNTGDALFSLAGLSLHRLLKSGLSEATVLAVQADLNRACLALTQGQHLDIAFETRDEIHEASYLGMVEGKTAALLTAATSIGARVAGAAPIRVEHMANFGRHLGMAFQMQDDILGIWGDPDVTGKPSGDDILCRKKTLPTLLGLERSEAFRALWSTANGDTGRLTAMRNELEACGSLEATQTAAAGHTERALTALADADPAEPGGSLLESLSRQMLGRQH